MPSKFGTSTDAKNTNYRRKRFYKKKPSVYSLSKRIAGLSKKVNQMPEVKHHDTAMFPAVNSNGAMFHLSSIPEGDSEITRTGLKITPKTLNTSLRITAEAGEPSNEVRFIMFRWYDDVAPTVNDLLQSNSSGIFNGYSYIDIPRVWPGSPKVEILSDRKMAIDPNSHDTMYYKFYKKFKASNRIRFRGPANGDIERGSIYLFMVTDSAVAPHPVITGYSRLTFTDV